MLRLLLCSGFVLLACGERAELNPAEAGRRVYESSCTACHHPDPTRDGPVGPSIAGSSQELIEARVLRAGYPEGYTPKRDTLLMQPLPYLKSELENLSAYLGGR